MKILITGRNGFLARHLIPALSEHEIITTGRGDDVCQALAANPAMIFHLGAELVDQEKMFETNVIQTWTILEWLRDHPTCKLVLFGSSSEYGRSSHPMAETDPLSPDTIYEGTKAAAAMLARSWSLTYGLKVTLIRPFTIYGPDEKPTKLTQVLARKWRDGSVLDLTEGVHDYVHVDDFTEAVVRIAFWDEPTNFNVVNIGSGVQKTNAEFVRALQTELGYTFPVRLVGAAKSYDSANWVADPTILKKKYGYEMPPFEHGIRRLAAALINGTTAN